MVSVTGTHGLQGGEGDYTCIWLGCTTPFHIQVWRTMERLGLLALYDGIREAKDIVKRTGLATNTVDRTLHELQNMGVVRAETGISVRAGAPAGRWFLTREEGGVVT